MGLIACSIDPEKTPNTQQDGSENTYPSLPSLDTLITDEMTIAKVPGLSACIIHSKDIQP